MAESVNRTGTLASEGSWASLGLHSRLDMGGRGEMSQNRNPARASRKMQGERRWNLADFEPCQDRGGYPWMVAAGGFEPPTKGL